MKVLEEIKNLQTFLTSESNESFTDIMFKYQGTNFKASASGDFYEEKPQEEKPKFETLIDLSKVETFLQKGDVGTLKKFKFANKLDKHLMIEIQILSRELKG